MAANTAPIFTLTPNIGRVMITTTYAQTKSDGTSAGSSADFMVKAFTAGASGSYVDRVRFYAVALAAATTSVATTLRVYLSTVAAPGATANTDTFLLGEISVPAIAASHSTIATAPYDIPLGIAIPASTFIHVSQHVAQTTNQAFMAMVIGGDY